MAPRLSVALITKNEAAGLGECLASVGDLGDEIVVLDSGSGDATVTIAREAGARVETRPFDGYGAQKQAALELCTGVWVLSLDADERVTPELAAEVRQIVAGPSGTDGYWIRREVWYLGTRLRFGGTGSDWALRLVRRDRARFSTAPVHERLEVAGSTARLRGTLIHYKYRRLSEHLATIDRYTELIARGKRGEGRTFHSWHLARIPAELFVRLVLKLGFLDGRAGIVYAAMASYYSFLKYAKLWPERDL